MNFRDSLQNRNKGDVFLLIPYFSCQINVMPKTNFENWYSCKVPEDLQALMHYLETPKGLATDWELLYTPNGHSDYWVCKQGHPLIPLFELPHGSIIAGWNINEVGDLAEMPFLWLDSEGEPTDVFAADYKELLGLLHYYSGTIYDLLKSSIRYSINPDRYSSPEERFSPEKMAEKVKRHWAEKEWLLHLHQFLEKTGIPIEPHPAAAIQKAFQAFPRFEPVVRE